MKLKWSLQELHKYQGGVYPINGQADLTNSLKERKPSLIDASSIAIEGTISIEVMQRYFVDLTLTYSLTLPSTRSLEPVEMAFETPFQEVYISPDAIDLENVENAEGEDIEGNVIFSLEKDILDLQKPIEDTILASIPMKVLSKEEQNADELPAGHDWEVLLENDVDVSEPAEEEAADPENSPFSVLKEIDLFDEEDAEDEE